MSPNLSPKYVLSQPRGGIPQQWSCWAAAQKISRYKYLSQYQSVKDSDRILHCWSLYIVQMYMKTNYRLSDTFESESV